MSNSAFSAFTIEEPKVSYLICNMIGTQNPESCIRFFGQNRNEVSFLRSNYAMNCTPFMNMIKANVPMSLEKCATENERVICRKARLIHEASNTYNRVLSKSHYFKRGMSFQKYVTELKENCYEMSLLLIKDTQEELKYWELNMLGLGAGLLDGKLIIAYDSVFSLSYRIPIPQSMPYTLDILYVSIASLNTFNIASVETYCCDYQKEAYGTDADGNCFAELNNSAISTKPAYVITYDCNSLDLDAIADCIHQEGMKQLRCVRFSDSTNKFSILARVSQSKNFTVDEVLCLVIPCNVIGFENFVRFYSFLNTMNLGRCVSLYVDVISFVINEIVGYPSRNLGNIMNVNYEKTETPMEDCNNMQNEVPAACGNAETSSLEFNTMEVVEQKSNAGDISLEVPYAGADVPCGSTDVLCGSTDVPYASGAVHNGIADVSCAGGAVPNGSGAVFYGSTEVACGSGEAISMNIPCAGGDVPNGSTVPNGSGNVLCGGMDIPNGSADVLCGSTEVPNGSADILCGSTDVSFGDADIPSGNVDIPSGNADVPCGDVDIPFGNANVPSCSADVPCQSNECNDNVDMMDEVNNGMSNVNVPCPDEGNQVNMSWCSSELLSGNQQSGTAENMSDTSDAPFAEEICSSRKQRGQESETGPFNHRFGRRNPGRLSKSLRSSHCRNPKELHVREDFMDEIERNLMNLSVSKTSNKDEFSNEGVLSGSTRRTMHGNAVRRLRHDAIQMNKKSKYCPPYLSASKRRLNKSSGCYTYKNGDELNAYNNSSMNLAYSTDSVPSCKPVDVIGSTCGESTAFSGSCSVGESASYGNCGVPVESAFGNCGIPIEPAVGNCGVPIELAAGDCGVPIEPAAVGEPNDSDSELSHELTEEEIKRAIKSVFGESDSEEDKDALNEDDFFDMNNDSFESCSDNGSVDSFTSETPVVSSRRRISTGDISVSSEMNQDHYDNSSSFASVPVPAPTFDSISYTQSSNLSSADIPTVMLSAPASPSTAAPSIMSSSAPSDTLHITLAYSPSTPVPTTMPHIPATSLPPTMFSSAASTPLPSFMSSASSTALPSCVSSTSSAGDSSLLSSSLSSQIVPNMYSGLFAADPSLLSSPMPTRSLSPSFMSCYVSSIRENPSKFSSEILKCIPHSTHNGEIYDPEFPTVTCPLTVSNPDSCAECISVFIPDESISTCSVPRPSSIYSSSGVSTCSVPTSSESSNIQMSNFDTFGLKSYPSLYTDHYSSSSNEHTLSSPLYSSGNPNGNDGNESSEKSSTTFEKSLLSSSSAPGRCDIRLGMPVVPSDSLVAPSDSSPEMGNMLSTLRSKESTSGEVISEYSVPENAPASKRRVAFKDTVRVYDMDKNDVSPSTNTNADPSHNVSSCSDVSGCLELMKLDSGCSHTSNNSKCRTKKVVKKPSCSVKKNTSKKSHTSHKKDKEDWDYTKNQTILNYF